MRYAQYLVIYVVLTSLQFSDSNQKALAMQSTSDYTPNNSAVHAFKPYQTRFAIEKETTYSQSTRSTTEP